MEIIYTLNDETLEYQISHPFFLDEIFRIVSENEDLGSQYDIKSEILDEKHIISVRGLEITIKHLSYIYLIIISALQNAL